MTDIWKPIPGFEGLYEVSNDGCVHSVARTITTSAGPRRYKSKRIAASLSTHGYLYVTLYDCGAKRRFFVHRLVAMAFLPTTDTLRLDVNHKNGIKTDNSVSNLEWCTRSENHKHAYRTGLKRPAPANGQCNPFFRGIIRATNGDTTFDLAGQEDMRSHGFDPSNVYACLSGRRKSHKGFIFTRRSA